MTESSDNGLMLSGPEDFPGELGTINHPYRAYGFARDRHRTPRRLEAISQPYQGQLLPELEGENSRARAGESLLANRKAFSPVRVITQPYHEVVMGTVGYHSNF
jgi:hypothetical protein